MEREPVWRRYLRFLGPNPAQDLDEELALHRQLIIEEEVARGASTLEAAARATARLGRLEQPRQECLAIARRRQRRADQSELLAGLGQDLLYALRGLRRTPGFTIVAVLTLALGIGANAAVFSIVDGVLLRPLPYGNPERLVKLWEHNLPRDRQRNIANPGNVVDWRTRSASLADVAMYTWSGLTFTEGGAATRVSGRAVEPNFFRLLQVRPALGRDFTPADGDSAAAPVIILSHSLWSSRFGADSSVVGRAVALAGGSAEIIGVAPAGFRPMGDEEYWEPLRLSTGASLRRQGRYVMALGRLRDSATAEQAGNELVTIARQLEQEYPEFNAGWSAQVFPLLDDVVGDAGERLWIALGAVGLVLLITFANLGNLLLVRASSRSQELAVRTALGASRGRVLRLWLVESGILAGAGLALGLAFAWAAIIGIQVLAPGDLPRLTDIRLNLRVMSVMAGVTLLIMFGTAATSLVSLPGRMHDDLRSGGRTSAGKGIRRMRHALVVAQVAFALILLAGAGLLVRTLQHLVRVDPGFEPAQVWSTELTLSSDLYPEPDRWRAFFRNMIGQVRTEPGVLDAGLATFLPLSGAGPATSFSATDRPPPGQGEAPTAEIRTADSAYFETMQIPLKRGRLFGFSENERWVVLVNETLAAELWPGDEAVGKQLKVNMADPDSAVTIIGVVGDVHNGEIEAAVRPTIYYSLEANPSSYLSLVVRTTIDEAEITRSVRRIVAATDRTIPLIDPRMMTSRVSDALESHRSPAVLLGMFAVLGLLLAGVGLYGVLAYSVGLRSREIGVRVALGARVGTVAWMVVRDGLFITAMGLIIGLAGAVAATRVLRSMLYNVSPTDPLAFGLTAASLLLVTLIASWFPAWRASRIDPVVTLRGE
jgi:putative ABC transport system permease protein